MISQMILRFPRKQHWGYSVSNGPTGVKQPKGVIPRYVTSLYILQLMQVDLSFYLLILWAEQREKLFYIY